MSFEPWKLQDPFGSAIFRSLSTKSLPSEEIELALRLCSSKYIQLGLIWARLGTEANGLREMNQRQATRARSESSGPKPLVGDAAEEFRASMLFSYLYELDHEDFILHSKILLDHIALLVCRLLADRSMPPWGFSKHRQYLLRLENKPYRLDDEYARFVREKTKWYEPLLKAYRDEFVEHNRTYKPFGTLTSPGRAPRPIRETITGHKKIQSSKELFALRDKYLISIPGLANVPLNNYELLDAFEENYEALNEADLKSLGDIRQLTGAKLPDPIELASHILELVEFVNDHFLKDRLLPSGSV